MKRFLDVVISATALLITAPILACAALAILIETGPPFIFIQDRVGRGFRRFRMYKLRTMRVGLPGNKITVSGDTRITRVGAILRQTKIDELPQFWNVLKGDMSIVGPRPEVPEYVELFAERYRCILSMRPGITDFASIEFGNEEELLASCGDPITEYREKILPYKLTLAEKYMAQQSVICDLSIIFRTAMLAIHRCIRETQ
jgi:lipopolysaccharide/colanic/teichoic acid biosynthesis glycosyltransferase